MALLFCIMKKNYIQHCVQIKKKAPFDYAVRAMWLGALCALIFAFVSIGAGVPKLVSLSKNYNAESARYEQALKDEQKYAEYSKKEIKDFAEQKAYENGYCYPDEYIFYDVS